MFAQAQRVMTQRLATLAGAAAFATVLGVAAPASAQSARYCDGNLVANSFYSNVLSNGTAATVEYHGQFQNMDPNRRTLQAVLIRIDRVHGFPVIRPMGTLTLNAYEQKDVVILNVQTQNAGGAGAPSPQQVGQSIAFACHFAP